MTLDRSTIHLSDRKRRFVDLCIEEGPREGFKRFVEFSIKRVAFIAFLEPIRIPIVRWRQKIGHATSPLRYSDADPFKIIYVDPSNVTQQQQYLSTDDIVCFDDTRRFHKWENVGKVAEGDWDLYTSSLLDHPRYQVLIERFVEGKSWEETDYIQEVMADVKDGNRRWNSCTSVNDVAERCKMLDELYDSMQREGYQRQHATSLYRWRDEYDLLTLNIDRKGEFIRNNSGGHRLIIAKILGIERIPARVLLRHRDWQSLRNQIRAGSIEFATEHPDLADIVKSDE